MLFLKGFKQRLIYRANTVIQLLSSFIYFFISINVWSALYRGKNEVSNISLLDMLTYILMVQIVKSLVKLPISQYVANRVTAGNIAIDFIRPTNIKYCAFFDSIGSAVFTVLLFSIPMFIIGSIFWGIILPIDFKQWLLFILSLSFAIILYATMDYIFGLTSFWTKTNYYIGWINSALMVLFSGSVIPLWFYPKTIRAIASILPFHYFIFEPINIFLGKVTNKEAIIIILSQSIWIVFLLLIERIVWHYAKKVITVQGG